MPTLLSLATEELVRFIANSGDGGEVIEPEWEPDPWVCPSGFNIIPESLAKKLGLYPPEAPPDFPLRRLTEHVFDITEGGRYTYALTNGFGIVDEITTLDPEVNPKDYIRVYGEPSLDSGGLLMLQTDNIKLRGPGDPVETNRLDIGWIAGTTARTSHPWSIKEIVAIGPAGDAPAGSSATPSGYTSLNTNMQNPHRLDAPSLSAMVLPGNILGIPDRDVQAVGVFMNLIPTIEFSRCAPFLNLRLIDVGAMAAGSGGTLGLSLMRALGVYDWEAQGMKDGPNHQMGVAQPTMAVDPGDPALTVDQHRSSAGMELFTQPQMLVNPYLNNASRPYMNAVDVFRPLLSLKTMTSTIYGSGYMLYAFQRAEISIVLHDRSRMAEVAELISPSAYGDTAFLMEYGWSHPDGNINSKNDFGKFLNALRARHKYRLVSSSYDLTDDGQVNITMRLAMLGGDDSAGIHVCSGRYVSSAYAKEMITTAYARTIRQVGGASGAPSHVNVVQRQYLNAFDNESTAGWVDRSVYIAAMRAAQDPRAGIETLEASLTQIEDGAIAPESITASLNQKMQGLAQSPDPFLFKQDPGLFDPNDGTLGDWQSDKWFSLGKLFLAYVGAPMAMSGKYDEVQMIFYTMNDQAGSMRNIPISSFPVNRVEFSKWEMAARGSRTNPTTFTVQTFIENFGSYFVNNRQNIVYGFYSPTPPSTPGGTTGASPPAAQGSFSQKLARFGQAVLQFRQPNLKVYFETVPAKIIGALNQAEAEVKLETRDILRIHVFDDKASRYTGQRFLLSVLDASKAPAHVDGFGDDSGVTNLAGIVEAAKNENLVTAVKVTAADMGSSGTGLPDQVAYLQSASPRAIKRKIMESIPTITFGSSHTAVISARVAGTTSGQVQDVLLIDSVLAAQDESTASQPSNLEDTLVIPATVTLTVYGCPLITYGQQFFVDFQTGTTVDNLYVVTNITHNMSDAGFTTDLTLTFAASGVIEPLYGVGVGVVTAARLARGDVMALNTATSTDGPTIA